MKFIFFLIVLLQFNIAHGQHKYDYTWIFGSQFGKLGVMLSFNENPLQMNPDTFYTILRSGVSIINDKEGVLQYYSTGCQIYNAMHQVVPGAENLVPHAFNYKNYCEEGEPWLPFGSQGMVFIPFSDGNYKVFYKPLGFYKNEKGETKLRIDTFFMTSIQNGVAEIVDQPIYVDTLSWSTIAAVKHINDINYWLVTPHDSSDIYISLLVGPDGIIDTIMSNISGLLRRNHNGSIARFSPDGNFYIGYEETFIDQALKVLSFDRSTGKLDYLYDMPHPEGSKTSNIGGIEFSASGRYLYCSTPHHIYQYDLEASNVEASKTIVASWDSPHPQGAIFYLMQRGPDCRIYINSPNSQPFLHVIMYPDRPGLECEVVQQGLPLPYKHQGSMPYFPNYRLGTGEPVCDSTLSLPTSIPIVYVPEGGIRVWPNPARGQVWLGLSESMVHEAAVITLYNMMGRQVWQQDYTGGDAISIDLYSLSPGIYVLQVQGRDGRRWTEKLIVE